MFSLIAVSVNPIVSTSQVISFTSVLPMSLNSTQDIDVPPISPSVTAIHSVRELYIAALLN